VALRWRTFYLVLPLLIITDGILINNNLKTQLKMKTTNQPDTMDVIKYTIAGVGFLGIVIAITVFELAK
jgi:hypothetical protein